MKTSARTYAMMVGAVLAILMWGASDAGYLGAKDKSSQVSSDDPTLRLFSLLDSKFKGKLDDLYLLADTFPDPKTPGQQQQHVLRIEYNKDHAFGKLKIYMRTVSQLTPEQLKAYSPKQIYDFGETDMAKFTKTDPGPFGKPGDVYFATSPDGSTVGTLPITPESAAQYDRFVAQYVLPALEKKAAGGS